jgi:putative FmdB family regulatory protein
VPLYEYRCRTCDDRFEMRRSMADADEPAACPDGHADAVRLLSVFAATGRAASSSSAASTAAPAAPCGSSCACAH